jgi:hypothetical protein
MSGNYIDSNGQIRNLDGTVLGSAPPGLKETMQPWLGEFVSSDGSIHSIEELAGGGEPPAPPIPAPPAREVVAFGAVLAAAEWVDGVIGVSNARIGADTSGIVRLAQGAGVDAYDAYDAFAAAKPHVSAQADGGITLTAFGVVPAVDLPVEVVLFDAAVESGQGVG